MVKMLFFIKKLVISVERCDGALSCNKHARAAARNFSKLHLDKLAYYKIENLGKLD